ncbi:MAG: hypothetical protein JXA90_12540 [Planctomycetes bacterium]|nr:hypothetical protein [Planctomycetota bacterium]
MSEERSFPAAGESASAPHDTGGFRWVGPGRTGFLWPDARTGEPPSRGEQPAVARVDSLSRARSLWPAERSEDLQLLEAFFEAGGGECRVLRVGSEPREWIGEDGGPGEGTGVHALIGDEEVGCVVWPPFPAHLRGEILRVARKFAETLFIAEERRTGAAPRPAGSALDAAGAQRSGGEVDVPLPNLVLLAPGAPAGRAAAELAGRLEAGDLQPLRAGRVERGALSNRDAGSRGAPERGELDERAGRRGGGPRREAAGEDPIGGIRAWRVHAALRRSLDHGSRWVLFEPDHPLVRRRLEREARSFIHDLSLAGVLAPWGGDDLVVRCEAAGDPGGERRVELRIRVSLAGGLAGSRSARRAGGER